MIADDLPDDAFLDGLERISQGIGDRADGRDDRTAHRCLAGDRLGRHRCRPIRTDSTLSRTATWSVRVRSGDGPLAVGRWLAYVRWEHARRRRLVHGDRTLGAGFGVRRGRGTRCRCLPGRSLRGPGCLSVGTPGVRRRGGFGGHGCRIRGFGLTRRGHTGRGLHVDAARARLRHGRRPDGCRGVSGGAARPAHIGARWRRGLFRVRDTGRLAFGGGTGCAAGGIVSHRHGYGTDGEKRGRNPRGRHHALGDTEFANG